MKDFFLYLQGFFDFSFIRFLALPSNLPYVNQLRRSPTPPSGSESCRTCALRFIGAFTTINRADQGRPLRDSLSFSRGAQASSSRTFPSLRSVVPISSGPAPHPQRLSSYGEFYSDHSSLSGF
jgi:hypothetical protein